MLNNIFLRCQIVAWDFRDEIADFFFISCYQCRQRAPVENVPSASGISQLSMIDIQATTKSKYYDHIVLLYLESRRCRYRSIIFVCFYLYVSVVNFIDYSDMDKMMDINNDLFIIYLRFIITLAKGVFDLQIDKKKKKHCLK
jgi:hypothetical protein